MHPQSRSLMKRRRPSIADWPHAPVHDLIMLAQEVAAREGLDANECGYVVLSTHETPEEVPAVHAGPDLRFVLLTDPDEIEETHALTLEELRKLLRNNCPNADPSPMYLLIENLHAGMPQITYHLPH
jgi:hypothetical protein